MKNRVRQKGRIESKGVWDPYIPPEPSPYNYLGEPILLREPPDVSEKDVPTLVDLFSGAGGFSLGFEKSGFKTILGLDILKTAAETFTYNFPSAGFILGDVRKVKVSDVRTLLGGIHPVVLTAGVPCQGFSLNNRKRNSEDECNFLFLEMLRFVEALEPQVVVVENVPGMRSARSEKVGGSFVVAVEKALSILGYKVSHRELLATDFGVPQARKRLFFVAVDPKLRFSWPQPTTSSRPVTVWEALGDLPKLEAGEVTFDYDQEPHSDYAYRMRAGADRLFNHEAPKHDKRTLERIARTLPGEPLYDKYKQRIRLHPERPSPTIVAGGIRPQFFFAHPTQIRGLTVREQARLQGFPDTFVFLGGIVQGRVLTGNAVPPPLVEALAIAVKNALKGEVKEDSRSLVQMALNLPTGAELANEPRS